MEDTELSHIIQPPHPHASPEWYVCYSWYICTLMPHNCPKSILYIRVQSQWCTFWVLMNLQWYVSTVTVSYRVFSLPSVLWLFISFFLSCLNFKYPAFVLSFWRIFWRITSALSVLVKCWSSCFLNCEESCRSF